MQIFLNIGFIICCIFFTSDFVKFFQKREKDNIAESLTYLQKSLRWIFIIIGIIMLIITKDAF